MSDNENKITFDRSRIGFLGIFFLILFILKVGVIETVVVGWSWWWIAAPLWGPVVLLITVPIAVCLCTAVVLSGGWLFMFIWSLISRAWKKIRK